jgi:hypothetical protein
MFAKELTQAGHTRRFTITEASELGWEVREEQDSRVVRQVHYTDWHRVERALSVIALQVVALEEEGWRAPEDRRLSSPPTA